MPSNNEKAVGSAALAEVRDWVREQIPAVDTALNAQSGNAIANSAVATALNDYVPRSEAANYMGAILRITFDNDFAGQTYTVTGGGETFTGTVPAGLVVNQTVHPVGLTTYTISATASGASEATEYTQDVQFYGVYPIEFEAGGGFEIVSWADGTDEQIAALLAAADEGRVDLVQDAHWAVGDVRTVQLSAMAATGVGETHAAQSVQLVLSHAGATAGISRVDGGTIHFQVDMKDALVEKGYMNSSNTNAGSWEGSARRTWCNEVFYNALPATLKAIFKQMKVKSAETYNGSTVKETSDYFALRAEKEIFGSRSNSNQTEADALAQVTWYATAANRVKKTGTSGSADYWWERSPRSSNSSTFCYVSSSGSADYHSASSAYGLAPFGCI